MAMTLAASVTPGRALIVAVAGWPTLIEAASPSLKPATTCSLFCAVIVMKLEEDDEDESLAAASELEFALEKPLPLAETVSPTAPSTDATTPETGARSVVSR